MDHTHWTDYLDDDGLMWGIEVILVGYTPPLPATRADPSEPWDCTVAQTTAKCEDGTRVEQAGDGHRCPHCHRRRSGRGPALVLNLESFVAPSRVRQY